MPADPHIEAEATQHINARPPELCLPQPVRERYCRLAVPTGWMRSLACGVCLLLAASAAAAAQSTASATTGQKPNATSAAPANTHAVHPHHRNHRKEKAAEIPPPPPAPIPPAQQTARPATLTFTGETLRIDADNSSLVQILQQVSHATGIMVDGLGADERIYGQYGPGPVTSTLSKLLDGAGYNYVIVGGGPGSPPTKLLLTAGPSASAIAGSEAAAAPSSSSAPVQPSPATNSSEPARPKTPQEIFNELRRMHPR